MLKFRKRQHSLAPLLVGGATLTAGGLLLARRRASARTVGDGRPYDEFVARFRLSHEALRRNLGHFVQIAEQDAPIDNEAFGEFIRLYGQFLVVHHESEDRVIFPTLRKYGPLRTTDAAHLDQWSAEHRDINAIGEALSRAGNDVKRRGRAGLSDVRRVSSDLAELLKPHLASEEELFTPTGLAEMIPTRAMAEIERGSRRVTKNAPAMAMFFAHSLNPDEQKEVFGRAPWNFRKVILPSMDRRRFARLAPFSVSPVLHT